MKDALFAAIEAADQVDASAGVGRALGEQPAGFRFGLKALSVSEADPSIAPTMADLSEKDGPVSAKAFNSSAYALAQADKSDAAFGLGFEFTHVPLETPDAESICPFDQGREAHRDGAGALNEAARIDDRDEPVVGDDYLWGRVDDDQSGGGDEEDPAAPWFDEFRFVLQSSSCGDMPRKEDVIKDHPGSAGDRERRSDGTGADNIFGYAGDDMVLGGEASKRLSL